VRGPHRLSAGGRGDGAAEPHRLHAQPPAHGDGQLPDQGPRHRLALRGERYFALQLNDYDLASNNGGWQWAASTGCDAQPWFRIFNPVTQSKRFDPDGEFIRRWLPQLGRLEDKAIHAPWLAPAVLGKPAWCWAGLSAAGGGARGSAGRR
jgi:hypothetical protein